MDGLVCIDSGDGFPRPGDKLLANFDHVGGNFVIFHCLAVVWSKWFHTAPFVFAPGFIICPEIQPGLEENSEEGLSKIQAVAAEHRAAGDCTQAAELIENKIFERIIFHWWPLSLPGTAGARRRGHHPNVLLTVACLLAFGNHGGGYARGVNSFLRLLLVWLIGSGVLPLRGGTFDLIIRGGRVADGTGNPAFFADVAVKDGRVAALGKIGGDAKLEIDARGLTVAPGFIDVHTHAEEIDELPLEIGRASCRERV